MTLDLTGIATSVIAGVFSILAIVIPMLISARMSNTAAAATMSTAIKNSLGAIEQASEQSIGQIRPTITFPGVSATLTPGVRYVLDHAGAEATRLNLTPIAIADKINAQIGLAKIVSPTTPTVMLGQPVTAPAPIVANAA